MLTSEARVWLVEDMPRKRDEIIEVVETTGGQIVEVTNNEGEAHGILRDGSFPANIGNPNVVLLDNELEVRGRPSGDHIFQTAFRKGLMHGTKHGSAIGLLAIGESSDPVSDVSVSTGANYRPGYGEAKVGEWPDLMQGQPAEPFVPTEGLFGRLYWNGELGETLAMIAKESKTALLLQASRKAVLQDGVETTALAEEEGDLIGEELVVSKDGEVSSIEEVMARRLHDDKESEDSYLLESSSQAIIVTKDELIVVRNAIKRNLAPKIWQPPFWTTSEIDAINVERLSEIPDAYWDEISFRPPSA